MRAKKLLSALQSVPPIGFTIRVVQAYIANDMMLYAAALSFHALLAIFPFMIFFLALVSFLRIPGFFDWLLEQASVALPEPAFAVVNDVVNSIQAEAQGGLLSVGAILAFGAASAGVRALMKALNSAYSVAETRVFWKKYLYSFAYTLSLAILVIVAGSSLFLGPQTLEWLSGYIGMGEILIAIWSLLRYPIGAIGLMLICALVYYAVPNIDQPFRFIVPGAIVAVFAWLVASVGFSIYVAEFASYDATYGSLAGIIILLFYFFISAAILLAGAEINAEVYRLKRGLAHPKEVSDV